MTAIYKVTPATLVFLSTIGLPLLAGVTVTSPVKEQPSVAASRGGVVRHSRIHINRQALGLHSAKRFLLGTADIRQKYSIEWRLFSNLTLKTKVVDVSISSDNSTVSWAGITDEESGHGVFFAAQTGDAVSALFQFGDGRVYRVNTVDGAAYSEQLLPQTSPSLPWMAPNSNVRASNRPTLDVAFAFTEGAARAAGGISQLSNIAAINIADVNLWLAQRGSDVASGRLA